MSTSDAVGYNDLIVYRAASAGGSSPNRYAIETTTMNDLHRLAIVVAFVGVGCQRAQPPSATESSCPATNSSSYSSWWCEDSLIDRLRQTNRHCDVRKSWASIARPRSLPPLGNRLRPAKRWRMLKTNQGGRCMIGISLKCEVVRRVS